jgi:hypothetical protein
LVKVRLGFCHLPQQTCEEKKMATQKYKNKYKISTQETASAPPNNLVPLNSGERTSKIFTDRSSMQAMSYVQGFLAQYLLSIIKS